MHKRKAQEVPLEDESPTKYIARVASALQPIHSNNSEMSPARRLTRVYSSRHKLQREEPGTMIGEEADTVATDSSRKPRKTAILKDENFIERARPKRLVLDTVEIPVRPNRRTALKFQRPDARITRNSAKVSPDETDAVATDREDESRPTKAGRRRIVPGGRTITTRSSKKTLESEPELESDSDSPPPSPTKHVLRAACEQAGLVSLKRTEPSPAKRSRRLKSEDLSRKEVDEIQSPKKQRMRKQVQFDDSGHDITDVEKLGAYQGDETPDNDLLTEQVQERDATSSVMIVSSVLPYPLPHRFQTCLVAQKRAILKAFLSPSLLHPQDENSLNSLTFNHLSAMLSGTVERGEGNSCLLLGPPGSGKTHVFEQALSEHGKGAIVIKLNGYVHYNDRLAMREIARQVVLQTGNELFSKFASGDDDDDENPFLNDDDHLLPNGITGHNIPPPTHLPALISSLPMLSRPVIVLLDAFDLFTSHARQALLYCLFDAVQSCSAGSEKQKGLSVIGLTSRIDVVTLLEKRVKSRFSHRILRTSGIRQESEWLDFLSRCLSVPLELRLDEKESASKRVLEEWKSIWKKSIEEFMKDRCTRDTLRNLFGISRDVKTLVKAMMNAVVSLSHSSPYLIGKNVQKHISSQQPQSRSGLLADLSYPLIALVIAAHRSEIAGHPIFTFEMLYDIFCTQVRTSSAAPVMLGGVSIGLRPVDRAILLGSLEQLVKMKIFVPASYISATTAKEYVKYRIAVEREDIKMAVERIGQTNLKKWFSKAQ